MIRRSLVVKAIFIAACFGVFHVTPTAATRGMKGLTSGIGSRSRKVLSKAHIPEDPAEKALKAEKKRLKAVSAQCCADLHEVDGAGEWADGTYKQKWPKSCLVDGATCPWYDFHGLDPVPEVPAGGNMCVDKNGNTIMGVAADTSNRSKNPSTSDISGAPPPPCDASAIDRLRFEFWCWVAALAAAAIFQSIGGLYCATLPLKNGDEDSMEEDKLTYEQRLLVVCTLLLACGGATIMFLLLQVYLVRCIWILSFTQWVLIPALLLTTSTGIAMRPLPHRMPSKAIIGHRLFQLWRDYFGFEVIYDDYDLLMKILAEEGLQFLLAQSPHAIMPFGAILGMSVAETAFPGVWPMSAVVASALLRTPVLRDAINVLGVRKAGTNSILQMFADGFKAVCVVTGGIAEMFVSRKKETLACLRTNFARIAFKGGYAIITVYCFGVSRTHDLLPGVDNRLLRYLSRKLRIPLILFRGAFGLIPHRKKLTLVVGSPILVKKDTAPVSDDKAQGLCNEVQTAVTKLFSDHKPTWETREISYEP